MLAKARRCAMGLFVRPVDDSHFVGGEFINSKYESNPNSVDGL
jgi:hypothetical protein